MKLWPRFRLYWQSIYGIVSTYNIEYKFASSLKVQPHFEEILCTIKYVYVSVLLIYNRTIPVPLSVQIMPGHFLFNYLHFIF